MLKIEKIVKNYKDFSLKGIDLELESGCIMGLIGRNGSGKTTLISIILNFLEQDSGNVKIFGTENNELSSSQREDIGIVFDDIIFPEDFKVYQVRKFCSYAYNNWDDESFKKYIDKYDLNLSKRISELSKGMKMKLQLAVAFSHNPKILFLDEATAGLDPIIRDELLDELFEFVRNGDRSVLMSSHILSDIEKVADMVTYIDDGKIIVSGYKDDLIEKYGIIKGDESILNNIPNDKILGVKKGHYGIEVCVEIDYLGNQKYDKVTLEDIMIFLNKKSS